MRGLLPSLRLAVASSTPLLGPLRLATLGLGSAGSRAAGSGAGVVASWASGAARPADPREASGVMAPPAPRPPEPGPRGPVPSDPVGLRVVPYRPPDAWPEGRRVHPRVYDPFRAFTCRSAFLQRMMYPRDPRD